VFSSRQAIVIGPTPPGTGVTARAWPSASVTASPTIRDPPFAPATRLMPTSITTAPGFTQSPLTNPASGGDDQDVGGARDDRQVAGVDVRHRHRRLALEQQQRDRLADDVRFADHHRVEAVIVIDHAVEQLHAAERCARDQFAAAGGQPPDIDRMEPVDILGRRDPVQNQQRVDLRRERQLDQDAVHCLVRVQSVDQGEQRRLGRVGGQPMLERAHASRRLVASLRRT
jgi:hypothetical protein